MKLVVPEYEENKKEYRAFIIRHKDCIEYDGFGDSPDAEYMRKKLSKENPGYEDTTDIKWNFTKFLINRYGEVVARFEPTEDLNLMEQAVIREIKG